MALYNKWETMEKLKSHKCEMLTEMKQIIYYTIYK